MTPFTHLDRLSFLKITKLPILWIDSTDSVSDAELEQLISQETDVDDEGVGVSDSETSMVI